MTPEERQHEIVWRRRALWQRRYRETYLEHLPQSLADYLAACPCVYTPPLDDLCARWYPIESSGLGREKWIPPGYHYREVFWPQEALSLIAEIDARYDRDAALLIPALQVAESPGILVSFGWTRRHLSALWDASEQQLFLVQPALQFGFAIDNWGTGPADRNPNPRGVAYEVAWWG